MPNRIIKESISKSERISNLSDFQFRLWVLLLTYVDDYGRGDARPAIIKGACFPLRERMTTKDIEKGLADLAGAGCVGLYTVDGRPYLYFPNWEEHQRVRTKISKCPGPENGDVFPSAADCGELPQIAADCGEMRLESRIQNPESRIQNTESNAPTRGESQFDVFWAAYPRKEGKKKAEEAFRKVTDPLPVILAALEAQKKTKQWQEDGGRFIPHPATWLNGKRWEDVVAKPAVSQCRHLDADEMEAIKRAMAGGGTK